jgi:methionyl-tRNA formyltransferase
MARLKTVFMGSDPIVLPLLECLHARHADTLELVGVVAQPDRPHGRGLKMCENPVKAWAAAHGIATRQPEKPGAAEVEWLREVGCDLLLVMAYGHILSDALLAAPRLPPLNFHASLLPELRGASPIETAIATGRAETGVTLMRIVKRMDAGDILDVEKVPIAQKDTRASLAEKLAAACVPLVERALVGIHEGRFDFHPQDDSRATYCRILTKDDAALDFRSPAQELHDRCRALHIWPGTVFDLGGQRIRVGSAEVIPSQEAAAAPGVVVGNAGSLDVATGRGILRIRSLQRPGGKMLPAADFLRGMPIAVGTSIDSPVLASPPLERAKK